MEVEEDGKLAFLDVVIEKKTDGTLGHTVYQKPTATNWYLHDLSHHHPAQINGVVYTLIHRSYTISDQDNFTEESRNLETILGGNGFDNRVISCTFNKVIKKNEMKNNTAEAANASINDLSDQKKDFLPNIKGIHPIHL